MTVNDNYTNPAYVARDAYLYPARGPAGLRGPVGPPGDPGPASAYPAVFSGPFDPPDFVEGSKPGDTWINTATGDTYILG